MESGRVTGGLNVVRTWNGGLKQGGLYLIFAWCRTQIFVMMSQILHDPMISLVGAYNVKIALIFSSWGILEAFDFEAETTAKILAGYSCTSHSLHNQAD